MDDRRRVVHCGAAAVDLAGNPEMRTTHKRRGGSMKYRVGKQFMFDAAHQLPKHDGKCRNLHGHTYRVEVAVSGEAITRGPKSGMVVDFGEINRVWREHIKPHVDHRNLNDSLPVPHTTAELIAGWMLDRFQEYLPYPMTVTVWETPTSWAQVGS